MKKIVISIVFLLCFVLSAQAQLILLEEDYNNQRSETSGPAPFVPVLGLTVDQYEYTPISGGVLLLCCLGGHSGHYP